MLCNKNYATGFGQTPDEILGKNDFDLYPRDLAEKHRADDINVMAGTVPVSITERYTENGEQRASQIMKIPLKDEEGTVTVLLGIRWDISDRVKAEDARLAAEEMVRKQAEEILTISTPVVQIWDGVVAIPLIGTLDSQRTQQIMEQLLQRIVDTRSTVALMDITGVPGVDTQTARHLIETVAAVRLLGAQVVLTGIRPTIAQTLVHLGVDLSGVTTRTMGLPDLFSGRSNVRFDLLCCGVRGYPATNPLDELIKALAPFGVVGEPLRQVGIHGPPYQVGHALLLLRSQVLESANLVFVQVDVGPLHPIHLLLHGIIHHDVQSRLTSGNARRPGTVPPTASCAGRSRARCQISLVSSPLASAVGRMQRTRPERAWWRAAGQGVGIGHARW